MHMNPKTTIQTHENTRTKINIANGRAVYHPSSLKESKQNTGQLWANAIMASWQICYLHHLKSVECTPVSMFAGQRKRKHRDRDNMIYRRIIDTMQELERRGRAWCKSLGLKRWVEQLFGMRHVESLLYWSWHPGNYDARWFYHDCNCKCKSCSAATLFSSA